MNRNEALIVLPLTRAEWGIIKSAVHEILKTLVQDGEKLRRTGELLPTQIKKLDETVDEFAALYEKLLHVAG
jgi:hypothetical protein